MGENKPRALDLKRESSVPGLQSPVTQMGSHHLLGLLEATGASPPTGQSPGGRNLSSPFHTLKGQELP